MSCCIKFFFLVVSLQWIIPNNILAQNAQQMLLFQIDGNSYSKDSYNSKGQLVHSQLIKVGKITKYGEKYFLQIALYDKENGKIVDSSFTKYYCNPTDKLIFMSVIPFVGVKTNQKIIVDAENEIDLYPEKYEVGKKMEPMKFSLSIEGGTLGFLGANSKISIQDRKIAKHNSSSESYTIVSNVEIKAFLFGIRVETINYNVEEIINPKKGIIYQKYKEDNGVYYIIELI